MDQGAAALGRAHERAGEAALRPINRDWICDADDRNQRSCITVADHQLLGTSKARPDGQFVQTLASTEQLTSDGAWGSCCPTCSYSYSKSPTLRSYRTKSC